MTTFWLYDEIGDLGCSAAGFTRELAAAGPGPVSLHINSPGGGLFDGIAIYHALRDHPGKVTVCVDGLAASVASIIAMAADPGLLFIAKNATMVIHEAWSLVTGPASEMRKQANVLDSMTRVLASIYAERTGVPEDSWLDAMALETFYTGAEAVSAKLADAVLAIPVAA